MSQLRQWADKLKGKIKLRVALEPIPEDCTEEDVWLLEAYTQGKKDGYSLARYEDTQVA
ncbi:hypothetical protein LCGC14_2715370 [marine sediment metagenome]|uniref:Uncharacterized protein n=1 Tax=marine sediment metagenome TaxID=412755 RepID=A0A0F9BKR7_9ZZZZ